jgi:CheY-like chemotaxis protein
MLGVIIGFEIAMTESKLDRCLRFGGAIVLGALAVARTLGAGWQDRMDGTFFVVVGVAILLFLIPISRLRQLKAGSLELSLDRPEVVGAIGGLNLPRVEDEQLRAVLRRAESQLPTIRRSRLLWIDDHPEKLVALRRLLRALGVDVVSVTSSEDASRALFIDNDFDLLISDVHREGETHKLTGGVPILDGTNFVVWLRTKQEDPAVRSIPVVFYAAYDWQRLVKYTRSALETEPQPVVANAVPDFVEKVINALEKTRTAPFRVGGEKEPS